MRIKEFVQSLSVSENEQARDFYLDTRIDGPLIWTFEIFMMLPVILDNNPATRIIAGTMMLSSLVWSFISELQFRSKLTRITDNKLSLSPYLYIFAVSIAILTFLNIVPVLWAIINIVGCFLSLYVYGKVQESLSFWMKIGNPNGSRY